jgi:hypothetical protein
MSLSCMKWRDTDVWFRTGSGEEWEAGSVVDVQENSGVWKFSVRRLEVGAGVVTIWPQCSGVQSHNSSFLEFDSIKRRNLQDAETVHDLTKLHGVSEPEVERILADRFLKHLFYTEVGPVLMYLNYWGDLDNNSKAEARVVVGEDSTAMSTNPAVAPSLLQVFEAGERRLLHQITPHPYKLAERVYRAMNLDARDELRHENQTIILTGIIYFLSVFLAIVSLVTDWCIDLTVSFCLFTSNYRRIWVGENSKSSVPSRVSHLFVIQSCATGWSALCL